MILTSVLELEGAWRRTLLVDTDGSRDTNTSVVWVQAGSAFVDVRGFAGELTVVPGGFEWTRESDREPLVGSPDAGVLELEAGVLLETGLYADYVEHWVRIDAADSEGGGWLRVRSEDGRRGLLVRTGDVFGWARGRGVGPDDCEFAWGHVEDGAWLIADSTLAHRVGHDLAPRLVGGALSTSDAAHWAVHSADGSAVL